MQVCGEEYEKIGKDEEIEDEEIEQKEQEIDEEQEDDEINVMSTYFQKWKLNSFEYLNDNDEDEKLENRLYIISIDKIPYFYEKTLVDARNKMWKIANQMLKSSNDDGNYQILCSNVNEIKIISPYKFFLLNYHHVLFHFTIDYVLPTNK